MSAYEKSEKTKAIASSSDGERQPPTQAFTLRGRRLDTVLPTEVKKGGNPFGDPVMGRQRSNSVRRLPTEHLQDLTLHKDEPVRLAAAREIGVREDLIAESARQFSPTKISALAPIGMREVQAMRFVASMAEEAHDELVREPVEPKLQRVPQLGQVAVARVGEHMGVGFSGKQTEMGHTRAVEGRMLQLQQHYERQGLTDSWSSRLAPVQVTDIFAEGDGNICAAKRAAHVAHTLTSGPDYLPPLARGVSRSDIPPPDSLIEMMNPAVNGRGTVLSHFSALRARQSRDEPETLPQPPLTISGRPRSASVDSMANSCKTCMGEHDKHMEKRQ